MFYILWFNLGDSLGFNLGFNLRFNLRFNFSFSLYYHFIRLYWFNLFRFNIYLATFIKL